MPIETEKTGLSNIISKIKKTDKDIENAHKKELIKLSISSELALYILNAFLKYIKNETFINLLVSVLFLPKLHYKILKKLKTPPRDLDNYEGDYNQVRSKITFVKYITENYSPLFIIGQMNNPNKKNEFLKLENKLKEKLRELKVPYNITQGVPYGFLMEMINSYYSFKEIRECREYHEIVSESTGIQCGLSFHKDRKSFIYLMNKNLKYIKEDNSLEKNPKNEKKYIHNEVYASFINTYKDCKDSFLFLSTYLFHQIINNEYVSKKLLAHTQLLNTMEIIKSINGKEKEEDSSGQQTNNIISKKEEKNQKEKKFKEVLSFANLYKIMYRKDLKLKEFKLYDNQVLSQYFKNPQTEYTIIKNKNPKN
jgi:hypothetical protein